MTEEIVNDLASLEVEEETVVVKDTKKKTDENEFVVPEKFKGKTAEEVIKSYNELEKLQGRTAQELGTMRQYSDALVQKDIENLRQKTQTQSEDEDDEFNFDDPEAAIIKAVEKVTKPLQDRLSQTEATRNLQMIREAHPDYQEIGSSPEFIKWVSESPIRTDLYARADVNLDFHAANELFTTFKERQKFMQKEATSDTDDELSKIEREAETVSKVNELKTASGSSGQTSSKKLKRSSIINLRATNPAEYERLLPEIRLAYQEGRVV